MTQSLYIGQVIKYVIDHNEILSNHRVKVYPLVAEYQAEAPYIVYRRDNIQSSAISKDGLAEDSVVFTIVVAAKTYTDSVLFAHQVRKEFDVKRKIAIDPVANNAPPILENVRMTSATEDYKDNEYLQQMTFICKIR